MPKKSDYVGVENTNDQLWIHIKINGHRFRIFYSTNTSPKNMLKAALLRAEIVKKIKAGQFVMSDYFPNSKHNEVASTQIFSAIAKLWLGGKGGIKSDTKYGYEKSVNFWNKHFKDKQISILNYLDIAGVINNSKLAASTLGNHMIVIRNIFDAAIALDLITKNPMPKVEIEVAAKLKKQFKMPEAIDPDNIPRILVWMDKRDPRWRIYFGFNFAMGLRPSEQICALWTDCFIDGKPLPYIVINKAKTHKGVIHPFTKNKKSREPILNSVALGYLKEQRAFSGIKGEEVFLNPNTGKPFFSNKAQRTIWTECLKELKIPFVHCYNVRHTFASHILNANPDLLHEVSKTLGHSSVEVTKKFYLSESKNVNVEAQAGIEAVLSKAAQKKKGTA